LITSVPHINQTLNDSGLRAELDGELYRHGLTFEQIISRTSRTVNYHNQSDDIQFHVFDVIANGPQYERTSWLIDHVRSPLGPVHLVSTMACDTLDEIMECYVQFLNKGYEGMIVRNLTANYLRRRSVWVMKFKPKKSDWYTVTGVQEEIDKLGQPKGTLGSIICMGDDGTRFRVGSGLTRDQRDELWQDKHLLLGQLCHVQYQHITPGKNVPRFPVFLSVDRKEQAND